jgi:predicted negative regulator of RcsB-dependent stress response
MSTLSTSDPVLEHPVLWDRYKRNVMAVLVIALLAVAAYGGYRFYSYRQEMAAANLLTSAKTPAEYQKIIADYSGTPAAGSAHLLLADSQRAEKKFTEANATLQTFLDKYPKHEMTGTARLAMAANLEELGKKDEALAAYQQLASSEPKAFTAPIALYSQIHLLKEKNQIAEARRVCETILTQYRETRLAGEVQRQLRILKGGTEGPATAPPVVAPPPATNVAPAAPPPPAAAPPAPQGPAPSAPPAKKP